MSDPLWIHVATVGTCFVSGLVPLVNAELYLLGVATLVNPNALPTLALAAAIGQMGAKTILYLAGRGVLHLRKLERLEAQLERARREVTERGRSVGLFLFLSASAGLPPFLIVSAVAGALRVRFPAFVLIGTTGRFLRFAVVLGLPGVVRSLF